jgi:hypothetical protein
VFQVIVMDGTGCQEGGWWRLLEEKSRLFNSTHTEVISRHTQKILVVKDRGRNSTSYPLK